MEDRWQLKRTNGSSEGFVFSVEGKTRERITAGFKMGAINTCSVFSFALSSDSRDSRRAPMEGQTPVSSQGGSGVCSAEMN